LEIDCCQLGTQHVKLPGGGSVGADEFRTSPRQQMREQSLETLLPDGQAKF